MTDYKSLGRKQVESTVQEYMYGKMNEQIKSAQSMKSKENNSLFDKYCKSNQIPINSNIAEPKIGRTFVLSADGSKAQVENNNGTGEDILVPYLDYVKLKVAGQPFKANTVSEKYPWDDSYEVTGDGRNKASDREFRKLDPCMKKNKERDNFLKNIKNIT